MQFQSQIVQRSILQCELIQYPEKAVEIQSKMKEIDNWLLNASKPRNFDPEDPANEVSVLINSFEELVANLEDMGVSHAYKLTVRQFYARVRYYKKKHAKQGSKGNNH